MKKIIPTLLIFAFTSCGEKQVDQPKEDYRGSAPRTKTLKSMSELKASFNQNENRLKRAGNRESISQLCRFKRKIDLVTSVPFLYSGPLNETSLAKLKGKGYLVKKIGIDEWEINSLDKH